MYVKLRHFILAQISDDVSHKYLSKTIDGDNPLVILICSYVPIFIEINWIQ